MEQPDKVVFCANEDLEHFRNKLQESKPKTRINASSDNIEKGLAQLVLTVIDLLRVVMEKQAIRRMENGTLTDSEIDRLGEAFFKLDQKMKELLTIFDLKEEDLNLNLGPLGNLK